MALPEGYWLPNGLTRYVGPRVLDLIACESVIDVGAGLRPVEWNTDARRLCVEPYWLYADRLRAAGFNVIQAIAVDVLPWLRADAIYMLDVIEHMERAEGELALELALKAARRQVVIYTPFGFLPQERDGWELGGDHWQKHRSGWTPDDFPGWSIQLYTPPNCTQPEGFYAVRTLLAD